VQKGETFDFLVESGVTETSDGFTWAPLIRSEGGEWNAEAQFGGPPSAQPEPLTAWEKYAQVLLASNEFAFVD
jgi:hypothetical protein